MNAGLLLAPLLLSLTNYLPNLCSAVLCCIHFHLLLLSFTESSSVFCSFLSLHFSLSFTPELPLLLSCCLFCAAPHPLSFPFHLREEISSLSGTESIPQGLTSPQHMKEAAYYVSGLWRLYRQAPPNRMEDPLSVTYKVQINMY